MSVTLPRRLAVLTTGRQDYGILREILRLLAKDPRFDLRLWVGGMHLRERFGRTVALIREDGLPVHAELDFVSEPPEPAADSGRAVVMVAEALRRERPEALLLVGDRHEVLAAAIAGAVERVPLVHLHGGEESEGAIDNAVRHAISKLSHLHLVSHEQHARRVRQMGEEPRSVVVVGAPGLDNLLRADLPDRASLSAELGVLLVDPVVLVTLHPTTLGGVPGAEVEAVADAMAMVPATYVITQPNADAGSDTIRDFWVRWVRGRAHVTLWDALGEARYWALLRLASAVLGNSSSGIIEAPEAAVPAVNVGDRQKGRLRGRGVIDVRAEPDAIAQVLRLALDPAFRRGITDLPATYPPGPASPRVVAALASWEPPQPPRKAFFDQ